MTILALDDVEQLVLDVIAQDMSARHALAVLRSRGMTPDSAALADAVHNARRIDGLLAGSLDAAVAHPGYTGRNLREHALGVAEDALAVALATLARKAVAA